MKNNIISESYLVTEEDFVNMKLSRAKYGTPKENVLILKILGAAAVFCGASAFINIRIGIYQIICWFLLIAIGLGAIFYYDVIDPYIIRRQAVGFFAVHSGEIASKTVVFGEEEFEISEENHKIKIPKEYIYSIAESRTTFLIFTDKNEFSFVPKRIFSEEQIEKIRGFVEAEKYTKL